MKDWKRTVPSIGCALAGVAFLFCALEERIIDGGPIHYQWFGLAVLWFAVAIALIARGRKAGSAAGSPPNA